MALSMGALIMSLTEDKFCDHLTNYIIMSLVQFCGALFGTALTFIAVIATYTNESYVDASGVEHKYEYKTYAPATPILCPA